MLMTMLYQMLRPLQWTVCLVCFSLAGITSAVAADWYVHHEAGSNKNPGTETEMLQTVQRAIQLAQPGDTIHLLPRDAVYRQSFSFSGKSDLTIEGNGVTLDGANPLPEEGWEEISPQLHRVALPAPWDNRQMLVVEGKIQRMGRAASRKGIAFPAPDQLQAGEFRWEPIDEKTGWLYVCGPLKSLEWTVRLNGLGTGGENKNLTVRNLNARHFLNDGFNIHGHAIGLVFENITGYDCFDEGFSAHEDSECRISDSKFWGSDNAVADVNDCQTHYVNCEFSGSVGFDVLLIGREHSLTNCKIINSTPAIALSAGPRDTKPERFRLRLEKVTVECPRENAQARVQVSGGRLEIIDGQFENAILETTGAFLVE